MPSLTLAGPELSTSTGAGAATWLSSLLQHDSGQVGLATEHYYAYNACVAQGSSNYPALHKYFEATDISSGHCRDGSGDRRRPRCRSRLPV